jgi:outer membrane protein assembly factor BamB
MRLPGVWNATLRHHVWLCGVAWMVWSSVAGAGDWNQWRGPERNGFFTGSPPLIEEFPAEGLMPVWITEEPFRGGWASPIVAGGKVYLYNYSREPKPGVELPPPKYPPLTEEQLAAMSDEEEREYEQARREENRLRQTRAFTFYDNITCLDAETGQQIWKQTWEGERVQWGQSSTPAVVDGVVYVVGSDRALHALRIEDGTEQWRRPLQVSDELNEPIPSSVAVVDGVAIVLATRLVGIDIETGEFLWEQDAKQFGGLYSSPAVWDGVGQPMAIINVKGGHTVAVDPRTGTEMWRVQTFAERSTPVITGDRMITYAGSRRGGLRSYRLSAGGAELEWEYRRASDPGASPVVVGDHIFVTGDKLLACVHVDSGRGAWTEYLDLSQSRYASPIAADRHVFYAFDGLWIFTATESGYQPILEAKFGEGGLMAPTAYFRKKLGIDELERSPDGQQKAQQVWRREVQNKGPIDCTTPAFADGRLYIRLKTGLACYDLRTPSASPTGG